MTATDFIGLGHGHEAGWRVAYAVFMPRSSTLDALLIWGCRMVAAPFAVQCDAALACSLK